MFKCRLKIFLSLPAPPASIPPETSAEAAALDAADRDMEKDAYSIAEALSCKALKNTYYDGYIIKGGELKAEAWIDFAAGAELKEKAQEVYAEPSGVVYTGDIYTYEGNSFAAAPFDEDPLKVVFSRCRRESGEAAGEPYTWKEIGQ